MCAKSACALLTGSPRSDASWNKYESLRVGTGPPRTLLFRSGATSRTASKPPVLLRLLSAPPLLSWRRLLARPALRDLLRLGRRGVLGHVLPWGRLSRIHLAPCRILHARELHAGLQLA